MNGASIDVARRFGENLRRARHKAGTSQEELGFRFGLRRTEIGLLERGARTPDDQTPTPGAFFFSGPTDDEPGFERPGAGR